MIIKIMRSNSKFNLKFLGVGIILFAIIFSFSVLPKTFCYDTDDSISFEEFSEQFNEMCLDDEYESIVLDDEITFSELSRALGYGIATYSSSDNISLDYDEIKEICDELGYSVHFDGENYHFDQHFGLKRLIVTGGKVEDSFGAINILTGYKDYTILEYSSVEQTEYAYNQLSQLENINVFPDSVVYVSETADQDNTTTETTSVGSHYTWGAGEDYINVDPYLNYISNNQDKTVAVAVLDTGIDTDHTMFTNRFLRDSNNQIVGASFLSSNGTSGTDIEDDDGHGTHVAGTVCDLTPDNVKIIPVKVFRNGQGYSTWTLFGLEYVANISEYDIVAVNLSISGDNYEGAKEAFDEVFNSIKNKHNALSIVAAGNDGDDASNYHPACCTDSAVVVSNMTQDKTLRYTSNYGSTIDITAPGTEILSANMGGGLVYKSGTSMAAPHVAAVVALLCLDPQYNGTTYSANTIENRLYDLTVDIGATGKDTSFGWGMLCLTNALGDISYSVSDTVVTYDGDYHNINLTITSAISCTVAYRINGVSNYYTDITSSVFNNAFKNAVDNMVVYFRITPSNNNYSITYGSASLTINPINITASINNATSVYGSSIASLSWSVTSGTYASGESSSSLGVTISTTATRTSGVGSYPITGTWTNKNYNISFTNGTYTITAKSISLAVNDVEAVYGTNVNTNNCSATATGLVNTDTISSLNITYSISSDVTSELSVGRYTNKISARINNRNYTLTSISTGDYVVEARPITLLVTMSSEYGDEPTTIVTSDDYEITGEYDIVSGDIVTISLSIDKSVINSQTLVGSYDNFILSSTSSNDNYKVEISPDSTYTISRRSIHIVVNNRTGIYGEEIQDDNSAFTVSNGSIVNNDNLNIDLTVNANSTSIPGRYRITPTYSNNNYSLTYTVGYFTINQRPIIIETTQTFTYGDRIVLDNSNYTLTFDSYTILDGDSISITLQTDLNSSTNAGTYNEHITLTENDSLYDITLRSGTIIITPRKITIELDDKTSVYGDTISNLTYKLYYNSEEVDESNLINFVSIEPSCAVDSTSGVGNYEITATTSQSDNYDITIINGEYVVTVRPIEITIKNVSIEYGESYETFNYTVNQGSVVNNDDLSLEYSVEFPSANQFGFYNVGDYSITAKSNNNNYSVSINSGIYSITKRKLSISTNQNFEFGSPIELDNNKYEIKTGSLVGLDTNLNITFSTTATSASDIGTYPITMSYNNDNYDVTLFEGILRIVGRIINITIYDQEFTYGENVVLYDFVLINGENVSISSYDIVLSTIANNKSNVGEYSITATCNNDNYDIDFAPATLKINKRNITISTTQSGVYGNLHTLDNEDYELTEGEIVNDDNLNLSLSTNAQIDDPVGTNYEINLLDCNSNYNVRISSDSAYSITPRQITITKNQTIQYGDEIVLDDGYTLVRGEVIDGDNLGVSFSIDEITNPTAGVSYPISLNNYTNRNYNITFNDGYLTIEARKITISTTQYGYYGDAPTFDYDNYTEIEGNVIANDDLELELITNATSESHITDDNHHYVIMLRSHNPNYDVTLINSSYVINPRPITISSYQTGVYGDEPTFDYENYIVGVGEVVNNDDLELEFSTNATNLSPISDDNNIYTLTLVSNNENYLITLTTDSSYTITKRNISITTNQTITYGDEIVLDNNNYLVTDGDVVNNDDLGLILSVKEATNYVVGEYIINLVDYSNKNYAITFNESKLTVSKREIQIEINETSSIYGEEIANPTFSLIEGYTLAKNDSLDDLNVNFLVSANVNDNVGNYDIVLVDGYNNNYTIICENGSYLITPREIEIVIDDVVCTYGDTWKDLTFSLASNSTLASNDRIDDLNISLSTDAETNVNAGGYDIYLENYSNKNYSIKSNIATYKIEPKSIRIEIYDQSSEYGNILNGLYFSLSEGYTLPYNDRVADLNVELSTTATSTSDVRVEGYEIIMSGYNNRNYIIDYVSGTYTITPRNIVIDITNKSEFYHNEHNLDNIAWSLVPGYEIVEGDNLIISLEINLDINSDAGEYKISANCNDSNYNLTSINGVYQILPREINVNILDQSSTYGDTISLNNEMFEFTGDELVIKSDLGIALSVNANETSGAGEYEITGICDNKNYDVNFASGTLTINKRKLTIKLNDQDIKRLFEFDIDQSAYEIVEGSVANNDDLNIEITSNANWYSNIGSEFELTANSSNNNYEIEFINATATMRISFTDYALIAVAIGLLILLVALIIRRRIMKKRRQQSFTDSFNQLKNMK